MALRRCCIAKIHAIENGCPIASFHLPLPLERSALYRDYLFFRSVKVPLACDADQKFLRLAIRLISYCIMSVDITEIWTHELNVSDATGSNSWATGQG